MSPLLIRCCHGGFFTKVVVCVGAQEGCFLWIYSGDFCIASEENRTILWEELITFQHLASQMLQFTLEETCQCWPNFLQALVF